MRSSNKVAEQLLEKINTALILESDYASLTKDEAICLKRSLWSYLQENYRYSLLKKVTNLELKIVEYNRAK